MFYCFIDNVFADRRTHIPSHLALLIADCRLLVTNRTAHNMQHYVTFLTIRGVGVGLGIVAKISVGSCHIGTISRSLYRLDKLRTNSFR